MVTKIFLEDCLGINLTSTKLRDDKRRSATVLALSRSTLTHREPLQNAFRLNQIGSKKQVLNFFCWSVSLETSSIIAYMTFKMNLIN